MKVNLNEVIDAIDSVNDDTTYYYWIPQERIISRNYDGRWNEPDLPKEIFEEDLIELPDRREIDDYGNMVRFIEIQPEGEAKEWLSSAIRGRGAFRQFRAAAEKFFLLNDWYDFQDECHHATAVIWCEENGIIYDEERVFDSENEDFDYEEEEVKRPVETVPKSDIRIVEVTEKNYLNLVFLKDEYETFRKTRVKKKRNSDVDEAEELLGDMLESGYKIFAASESGRFLGYIVLNAEIEELRLLELFVRKDYRRRKIATKLMEKAMDYAEEIDCELVAVSEPDNRVMIAFLKFLGFSLLEKLELHCREGRGETISVGEDEFEL